MSTYIDTHVMLWLYEGDTSKFSPSAYSALNEAVELCYSPMLLLELHYLDECGKLSVSPRAIINGVRQYVPMQASDSLLSNIISLAKTLNWTRDVFDRLMVAEASINSASLVTADRLIRKHYAKAIW